MYINKLYVYILREEERECKIHKCMGDDVMKILSEDYVFCKHRLTVRNSVNGTERSRHGIDLVNGTGRYGTVRNSANGAEFGKRCETVPNGYGTVTYSENTKNQNIKSMFQTNIKVRFAEQSIFARY